MFKRILKIYHKNIEFKNKKYPAYVFKFNQAQPNGIVKFHFNDGLRAFCKKTSRLEKVYSNELSFPPKSFDTEYSRIKAIKWLLEE